MRRAATDEVTARKGVGYASRWGATRILKILTQGWDKDTQDFTGANELLDLALMSDNADTVGTIRAFVPRVSENIVLAIDVIGRLN